MANQQQVRAGMMIAVETGSEKSHFGTGSVFGTYMGDGMTKDPEPALEIGTMSMESSGGRYHGKSEKLEHAGRGEGNDIHVA